MKFWSNFAEKHPAAAKWICVLGSLTSSGGTPAMVREAERERALSSAPGSSVGSRRTTPLSST